MSNIKVGDPYRYGNIYGRVVETDGGLVYFATPHGTIIKMGFIWFHRGSVLLTEWEDLNILFEFDQKAIAAGQKLYGGRLSPGATTNENP